MKYNLGIVNLHGKSQQFAVQEIVAAMLQANFTARVVNEVVMEKASDAKHEYAVNIKMATYLCKRFLRESDADGDMLMHEIAKFVEPVRPDRSDERKILS